MWSEANTLGGGDSEGAGPEGGSASFYSEHHPALSVSARILDSAASFPRAVQQVKDHGNRIVLDQRAHHRPEPVGVYDPQLQVEGLGQVTQKVIPAKIYRDTSEAAWPTRR